jgi:secreted trypsin-like serine protease
VGDVGAAGEVCNGDSGGPIFLGSGGDAAIVATVSYVGGCRASVHARVDTEAVQSWIAQAIKTQVSRPGGGQ